MDHTAISVYLAIMVVHSMELRVSVCNIFFFLLSMSLSFANKKNI